jgi:hypothetical protein
LSKSHAIEFDLRELMGIEDAGRELLSAIHQSGVRLVVQGVWMTTLMEEIIGRKPSDGAGRHVPRESFPAKERLGKENDEMKTNSILAPQQVIRASRAIPFRFQPIVALVIAILLMIGAVVKFLATLLTALTAVLMHFSVYNVGRLPICG